MTRGGPWCARLERPLIGVLGPALIAANGANRTLRGRSARALVGLVATGRPMSLDELADIVWPEQLPATYRPALHVHLGTVRKALALAPGASLQRDGDLYSLQLDGCEVDHHLAADLLTEARRRAAVDPNAARELVEDSLALWRGTPFAVDGDVVDAPASRQADAARRDAEELLVELLITGNDAAAAEAAALRFVAEEPLREVRWGQLLRARYLAGRTADALATFQEARASLMAELGIELGRELADLEAAALTDDREALRLPRPSPGRRLLPPPTAGGFVDREVELRVVVDRIARADVTVLLGPPGVGKTRLALEAARSCAGVAWIDVRDPGHDADVADLPEWVRGHPDGVIVFDNADLSTREVVAAVNDVRRRAPSVAVLVTSRVPLAVGNAVVVVPPLPLPPVGADDEAIEASPAAQMLRGALDELALGAVLSAADVSRVCHRAGGLPLALRLVAGAARALPVKALVERAASVHDDEIDTAVRAILDLLPDSTRSAFAELSIVQSFDDALASQLTGLDACAVEHMLLELVDHGLVQARPTMARPYSMLEPIREVAARLLDRSGRRRVVLDRHVDACIDNARTIAQVASGGVDGWQERLADELPRVRAALEHLAATGDADRAAALVCWLEVPLYALGWWEEKIELFDRALSIPGGRTSMRARAHAFRARPGPLCRFDADHAAEAEAIAAELGHDLLLAYARHVRGIGLWWSGQSDLALPLFADAADRFATSGRLIEECDARRFLAMSMIFQGDVAGGLELAHIALARLRGGDGTTFHVGHHLAYLGHCHRMLGDDVAARADLLEARTLFGSIGNRGSAIHVEIGLGDLDVDRGDTAEALRSTASALEMIRLSCGWTYTPWAWTVAMRAHARAGDLDPALTCARRALADLPRVPTGESVRLAGDLAFVAVQRGDDETAARLLGVARATPNVRELPFVPMAERQRLDALAEEVASRLGRGVEELDTGRRLSIAEAAGSLLLG